MSITFTPTNLANLNNSSSACTTINNNFAGVQTALTSALSTSAGGGSGNQMSAALDMNNNAILNMTTLNMDGMTIQNLGQPVNPNDSARLVDLTALNVTANGLIGNLTASQIPLATASNAILSSVGLSSGQVLVGQSSGAPQAKTVGGDGTFNASGNLTVTKTSGISFAPSATTDTTNASNVKYTLGNTGAVQRTQLAKNSEYLSILDFGADNTGVSDVTSAFNNFLTALSTGPVRRGYLPQGTYKFNSQPNSISTQGIQLFGDGSDSTILLRNYNGTSGLGFISVTTNGNGFSLKDVYVVAASGTSTGTALSCISSAASPLSFITIQNVIFTTLGTNTWDNTILFDGTACTSAPIGSRDLNLTNVNVFGSGSYSAVLKGVVNFTWNGGGIFQAGGSSTTTGSLSVTGTAGVPSNYVNINIAIIDGGLSIDNSNAVTIITPTLGAISGVSISNASSCNGALILCQTVSGSVQSNWVNSRQSNGASGSGSPGSPASSVQFNNSGSFGGAPGFIFDGTSKVTLGQAGSSIGSVVFNNVTSGSITLQPTTGALGTSVLTLPATTDTIVTLAATQALTNKTYNGLTLTTTTGTFTLTNGKTLSVNNTLTLTGTDSTTFTFPSASDTVAGIGTAQTFTKTNTWNIASTIASGASATLDDVSIAAATTTVTGSTGITTAKGFNKYSIYKPTFTAGSAVAVTNAATLYIENAPAVSGSLTITNPYSLWVNGGTARFDGNVTVPTGILSVTATGANPVNISMDNGFYVQYSSNAGTSTQIGFTMYPRTSGGSFVASPAYVTANQNALNLYGTGASNPSIVMTGATQAITAPGILTILNGTAIPAGGTAGTGYMFSNTSNFGIFFGSGVPTLSAAQGSLYIRSDGSSTSTRLYVNTTGSTTWTNVTTAT